MKKTTSILVGVCALFLAGVVVLYVYRQGSVAPSPSTVPQEGYTGSETLIIAFGDSLTAGYGLPLAETYPAILERTLRAEGYAVRVVNAGISGETTAGARERAAFIRAQDPDIVLLGIGGNDALRFLPFETTTENLDAVLATLTEGSDAPDVVLLQMQAPENAGAAYKAAFDALYPDLARTHGATLAPFLTEEVFRDPQYLLADGIHPNAAGYTLLVETYLAPAVTSSSKFKVPSERVES